MLRRETLRGFFLLLSTLPVTMGNSFVGFPGLVRGDVTGSAALEWTLESEPERDDGVRFTFNGVDVFRYIPYTGFIPPRVIEGPSGNRYATYDSRFSIYNSSTKGVGFRLAGLRQEDAGTYTCRYQSLGPSITRDAVLFVYDVPTTPTIAKTSGDYVEGETDVTLTCIATSTSRPVAHRPAMLYMWRRNGVDNDRTWPPERHPVLGEQTLGISPVHHTDTTYTCTASENGTQLTSDETEVTLDVLHGPYNLTLTPPHPSAKEDEALEITASADCNPACNFTWSTAGSSFSSQGPVLRFDSLLSCGAKNYTIRVVNNYGMSELTVELTLNENPDVPQVPYLAIIGVITAIACVSLTINVVLGTLAFRRGLFSCQKVIDNMEPGHPAAVYVNSGLVREPGNPAAGYVDADMISGRGRSTENQPSDTNAAYEEMNLAASREPAHPADIVPEDIPDYIPMSSARNLTYQRAGGVCPTEPAHPMDIVPEDGLDKVPMTSGEHHHHDFDGVYEPVDRRTREPVRPADKV